MSRPQMTLLVVALADAVVFVPFGIWLAIGIFRDWRWRKKDEKRHATLYGAEEGS